MGLGTSESERFSREYVLTRVRYTEVLLYMYTDLESTLSWAEKFA